MRNIGPLGPTFAELDEQARGSYYDDFDVDDDVDVDDEGDCEDFADGDETVVGGVVGGADKSSRSNGKLNSDSDASWPLSHTPDVDDGFNWDDGMPPIPVIVGNFF